MKNYILLSAVTLLFISCNSDTNQSAQQITESSRIESHIDLSIQGDERKMMREAMSLLPENARQNVLYIDENGDKHFNKPLLKNWFHEYKKVSEDSYISPMGAKMTFDDSTAIMDDQSLTPQSVNYKCPLELRAVYRRIWSKDGYSHVRAEIGLPGNGTGITATNAGTAYVPYVMLGGRTNTSEVDAGLQFSPTNNWWTTFLKVGSNVFCFDDTCLNDTKANHKPPGAKYIDFFVPVDGRVVIQTSDVAFLGIPTDTTVIGPTPTTIDKTRTAIVLATASWKKNGASQRLKRTTSIVNLPSNSGVVITMKPVKWRRVDIGTYGSGLSRWSDATYAVGDAVSSVPGYCTVADQSAGYITWSVTGPDGGPGPLPADEDVGFTFVR